ncbi:MAG: response regulator [Parcubacteria group bacterium CG10_big_fil_rev_8_21_14_0_10_38_31]|nr:MAG: response regulator [Parcubacteria group bacterium CG10_big_fil_rev_8_21_14_0_10_38_31]
MAEKQPSVFIVDDDEFILDVYSVKFREKGYKVEIAMSGLEALDKIKQGFSPDIMLLDIVMPKMDGFELLKRIRDEKLLSGSLIVILTNLGQKEDVQKGLDLKVDDYVVKAYFTPSEIAKKVEDLLSKKKDNLASGSKDSSAQQS